MNAMTFLINTVFDLYLMVVILRFWLQLVKADFYNPFSQFIVKATQPIVAPMRRTLPSIGSIDTATVVFALAVISIKYVLLISLSANIPVIAMIDQIMNASLSGVAKGGYVVLSIVVTLLKQTGMLLFWMLLIRAILSWFNQGYNPVVMIMGQLTEPLIAPIRRIIPPIGGIDLSVLAMFIAMNFLNILFSQYVPFWGMV
ncbi:YggT family protein [Shewanella intestini]|uniref:YggT family protein n=1 Tax=Shewanella intestini TaxID=2017544 RepID=A0ABS5I327_9GAMM|nr:MULTISPECIES: YggT family protein [Shewanella]MBR9728223.1 YggT family protein [Shewanella intestini]MRG35688.1 YggT family protein [Shewanella sp. XMDDZSB0408]